MQNLYRLANIIGLDTNNAQHTVALEESMLGIEDQNAFIDYCRDFKDSIEYASKPERLDTLSTRYKKLQDNTKLPHDLANSFSKELSKKVETARVFLKNELIVGNDKPFSRLTSGGEKYFTVKELKALSGLGSPSLLIQLSEQNKLEYNLVQLFLSKYTKKAKYDALSDNQKRVKQLIGSTS